MDITPLTADLIPHSKPVKIPIQGKEERIETDHRGADPGWHSGDMQVSLQHPHPGCEETGQHLSAGAYLREVSKKMQAKHPLVQNLYTLLIKVPHTHAWFSVIGLRDAFWSCPLALCCRNIFAFTWEDPDTERKQLCCTRLRQEYTESPTLFGQALEELLSAFSAFLGLQVTQ